MTATRLHAPLLFLAALSLYLLTSAPGLTSEDSAELATGARYLTMVHAPGYPLYLLAGRLVSALDQWPGRGLVLFSAFTSALAVSLLYLALLRLWNERSALVGAATLAVIRGFWDSAIIVEVYALQAALFAALFLTLVHLRAHPSGRLLRLFGLLLGLMLAHHVGVLILTPFLLGFLLWQTRPFPRAAILPACGQLLLGLGLYAALLLLSRRPEMPIVWWPPITSLGQLLHVAGGAGFRSLLFAVPPGDALVNLVQYPLLLATWLNVLSLILAALGLVHLARTDRPLLLLVGGVIAMTVFHTANYAVLDPESFLLPAALPLAILAGAGFQGVIAMRRDRAVYAEAVAVTILVVGIAGRLALGDLMAASTQSLPVDIARAVLDAHDRERSDTDVLVWSDWHLFPTLRYVQIAEGRGRRVTVELDSTASSPGVTFWPGRTWTMRPTRTVGALYPLVMEDLHWRVDIAGASGETTLPPPGPVPAPAASVDTPPAPLLPGHDLDLVRVDTPAEARFGEPIRVIAWFRRAAPRATRAATPVAALRDASGREEPPAGWLVLARNGRPILRTPLSPPSWHGDPADLPADRILAEPVQTLIPTAFLRAPVTDEYRLAIELGARPENGVVDLGPLAVRRDRE